MPGTLRIQANSQTLSVNLTRQDGTAASVFSDFGMSTPVTLPATISSDTSFYMPAPETYVISVKSNGSEIASDHGTALTQMLPEGRVLVIAPTIDPLERQAVEAGTFVAPAANTIVLIGDSRVARESQPSPVATQELGAFGWANNTLGGRFRVLNYAGISGQTSTQVLARWDTDVTAYAPGWVYLNVGVNDFNASATLATVQANVTAMLAKAKAAGIRVILCTTAPYNSQTAAQRLAQNQFNRWIKAQASTQVIVADIAVAVTDWVIANKGNWIATYSGDGLHANREGASRQGKVLADLLASIVPAVDPLPSSFDDTDNWVANPGMAGTVGTGNTPTSWSTSGVTGGVVVGIVARTDGKPGNWFEVDCTAVASDAAVTAFNSSAQVLPTTVTPGTDKCYMVCEFQTDAIASPTTGTAFYLTVQLKDSGGAVITTFQANLPDPTVVYPTKNQIGLSPATAVIRSPEFLVPANCAKSTAVVTINGKAKARFTRVGIYKV